MSQVKEQQKFPEKELKDIDEMETTQKPGTESKIMIRRALQDLKGRMDDLSENLNKETVIIKRDVETINKNQSEMEKYNV